MDRAERLSLILVLAVAAALAAAMGLLVAALGVDVFFSDQWMIYAPYFRGEGVWSAFALQHGPHRQGAGAFVMWLCASVSGWDARADSIAIVAIAILSCVAALVLKRKLFGRIDAADVAIPAIALNLVQVEAVLLVPNPAHGALPALFLLSTCIAWLAPSGTTRTVSLSLLAPLLLFTGFGLVATPVVFVLFALDALAAARREGLRAAASQFVPLVALAAGCLLFLLGYRRDTGQSAELADIVRFAALMPARFASIELGRFGEAAIVTGLLILGAFAAVAFRAAGALFRSPSDARSRTIFLLSSFTLLFVALASFGRAVQGAEFGQSSRYMPLLVPGMLALWFAARAAEARTTRVLLTVPVLVIALGAVVPPSLHDDQSYAWFSRARREWRDCYLETRDARLCAERAQFAVWVGPYDATVQARLDYLERNRLGPFRARR